ncbi:MAG TPA: YetF domain-containing protein [Actinomycetota bacterium]|jgi:uncharacterized membrane protein YcaP (DUF421 family)|nr:YetF domain-containing protein [Actinomycetota bacterium]
MEIIVRATALFFFVWGLMRVMGKRELAELTAFELVLLISIGDLIQQGVTQEDMSITGALLAVGTIGMWILAFSYASFRWRGSRSVIEGFPVVVVQDGRLLDEMLRLERLTSDEVLDAAREQGIQNLDEIRIGILEADGKFSFLTGKRHTQPDRRAE